MKRAFKNQRQPGSAVISAEGSRDLCIGTCSLAPPTTCPTLMTRERRAYGPTRASSDVPETGDGGGQSRSGALRGGAGRAQPPWANQSPKQLHSGVPGTERAAWTRDSSLSPTGRRYYTFLFRHTNTHTELNMNNDNC